MHGKRRGQGLHAWKNASYNFGQRKGADANVQLTRPNAIKLLAEFDDAKKAVQEAATAASAGEVGNDDVAFTKFLS